MIEIKNLTKKFDDFTAVDDLSLTIKTGEFFWTSGTQWSRKDYHHQYVVYTAASHTGRDPY